jgi:hypothetical protein
MDALPNRMDLTRTSRKVVKWGYRFRDGEAEWGEWRPASSATHAVELVQAELPEDAEAQALSSHRLYNQVGRGSRDGARKATRRPLPDHIEFRKL